MSDNEKNKKQEDEQDKKESIFIKKDKDKEDEEKEADNAEEEPEDVQQVNQAEEFYENVPTPEEKEDLLQEPEREKRHFVKSTIIPTKTYSWGNLDQYLHHEHREIKPFFRYLIEISIVFFLFMTLPIICVFIDHSYSFSDTFKALITPKAASIGLFYKHSLFITGVYIILVLSEFIMQNVVILIIKILDIFEIPIEGHIGTFLQVLNTSLSSLKNALAAFLILILSSLFYGKYEFIKETIDLKHFMMTLLFWYLIFSLLLFIENLIINIFIGELGRKNFSGRIYDANYKTFVFKKLAAIAQAKPKGKMEEEKIITEMNNYFESSIYLRHNDLNLTSPKAAENVAESIFGYFDIESLDFETLKNIFPENYEDVYNYLSKEDKNRGSIPYEIIKEDILILQKERMDIYHSLIDRDNILGLLNVILLGVTFFLGMILLLFLFNVDYKIYLASVGPFLFTFGWIFQGSVVEIYRCFVFLLFSHPFDVGDRVIIDGENLVVAGITLLYTTFLDSNNLEVYIPNVAMFSKRIGNVRRSNQEYDEFVIIASKSTTFSDACKFRDKLADNIKDLENDFTGDVVIKSYTIDGDNLNIVIGVQHTTNFQESQQYTTKREILTKKLEESLSSSGFSGGYSMK